MKITKGPCEVNDIHSGLNRTTVSSIATPTTNEAVAQLVSDATQNNKAVSVSGYRHAMGGQQFLSSAQLIDLRQMNSLISLNPEKSIATFQAGANWKDVLHSLHEQLSQKGEGLTFRQKQTGADNLSLGGAVAVNAHGRGLNLQAFVSEVESLTFVDSQGTIMKCSRTERPEHFSAIVGGYGLCGVVTEVELRLYPRHKVRRIVEVIEVENLIEKVELRKAAGFEYGDFQFRIDSHGPRFLQQGVFSCYEPVPLSTPISLSQAELSPEDWYRLLSLAHFNKEKAFELYAGHYLKTNDQIYWSDDHQMSTYLDGYHVRLDSENRHAVAGSEMITELYVPRKSIAQFLGAAAQELRKLQANVIYGTVRFIEADNEALLTWARDHWACTIFNLHVDHTPDGVQLARTQFLALIDIARSLGGSYFLTYHRWASKQQIVDCHPRIYEFLQRKKTLDPQDRFVSDWLKHLRNTLELDSYEGQ
jgi:FAD/FMN-containing dehydrogenase